MSYTELKKRKVQLRSKLTSTKNELEKLRESLEKLKKNISVTYESVKDFTVDYTSAKTAKNKLGVLKTKKKSIENRIKKYAKDIEILNEDLTKAKNDG